MAVLVAAGLLLGGMWGFGVEYETIQAVAQGQSTQLGQRFNFTLIIYQFSTADDQKALIEAFKAGGQQGLYNAVTKMKAKGHMALTGTLGYDVNYIKEFKMPDGSRKIRLVTDRPLRFGEMWSDTRSTDYSLSAAEIILSPEKDKTTGVLMPALELKFDEKSNELKLETFQNPWKLINIKDYLPKEK
jgi:hypothetical protein